MYKKSNNKKTEKGMGTGTGQPEQKEKRKHRGTGHGAQEKGKMKTQGHGTRGRKKHPKRTIDWFYTSTYPPECACIA